MKIELKKLAIKNFKGIKSNSFSFEPGENVFRSENGGGKTSLVDAFMWLLYGKDSHDNKDFNIKPLDAENATTDKLEVNVFGLFSVDGKDVSFSRTLKEKWVKPRGTNQENFTGNETLFEVNSVPMILRDYQHEVNSLIDEKVFKLVTNPMAFNTILSWQDRRDILIKMSGDVTFEQIISEMGGDHSHITDELNSGKSIENYKIQLTAERKKLKDLIDDAPARIDELQNMKPTPKVWKTVEESLALARTELESVNLSIRDLTERNRKAQEAFNIIYNTHQQKIRNSRALIEAFEDKIRQTTDNFNRSITVDTSSITAKISSLESSVGSLTRTSSSLNADVERKNKQMIELRELWGVENAKVYVKNEDDLISCPKCDHKFAISGDDSVDMEASFNLKKAASLEAIQKQGGRLKSEVEDTILSIKGIDADIEKVALDLKNAKDELSKINSAPQAETKVLSVELELNPELRKLKSELKALEAEEVVQKASPSSTQELQDKQTALMETISQREADLSERATIEKINTRIEELNAKIKNDGALMSEIEGKLFDIETVVRERISRVESTINSKFEYVKFKMFKTLVNGGEEEACEALINGVPFKDANTGSKINAGLDIIKSISEYFNAYAPIWIDNRESLSKALPVNSQSIHLYKIKGVSPIEKISPEKDPFLMEF